VVWRVVACGVVACGGVWWRVVWWRVVCLSAVCDTHAWLGRCTWCLESQVQRLPGDAQSRARHHLRLPGHRAHRRTRAVCCRSAAVPRPMQRLAADSLLDASQRSSRPALTACPSPLYHHRTTLPYHQLAPPPPPAHTHAHTHTQRRWGRRPPRRTRSSTRRCTSWASRPPRTRVRRTAVCCFAVCSSAACWLAACWFAHCGCVSAACRGPCRRCAALCGVYEWLPAALGCWLLQCQSARMRTRTHTTPPLVCCCGRAQFGAAHAHIPRSQYMPAALPPRPRALKTHTHTHQALCCRCAWRWARPT
jgi:hypothetical protein